MYEDLENLIKQLQNHLEMFKSTGEVQVLFHDYNGKNDYEIINYKFEMELVDDCTPILKIGLQTYNRE